MEIEGCSPLKCMPLFQAMVDACGDVDAGALGGGTHHSRRFYLRYYGDEVLWPDQNKSPVELLSCLQICEKTSGNIKIKEADLLTTALLSIFRYSSSILQCAVCPLLLLLHISASDHVPLSQLLVARSPPVFHIWPSAGPDCSVSLAFFVKASIAKRSVWALVRACLLLLSSSLSSTSQ